MTRPRRRRWPTRPRRPPLPHRRAPPLEPRRLQPPQHRPGPCPRRCTRAKRRAASRLFGPTTVFRNRPPRTRPGTSA
ncbi:MAG: hypothetical protein DCF29_24320 [Alphaproteobacteria bacterium]|nr:MAG: hypothetical protein DCF29_24320 [Alphaproteobacteria bacterium]